MDDDKSSSGQPNLFSNLKLTVSSFFTFLLCGRSRFRFPMQTHTQTLPFSISGLKTLIPPQQELQDRPRRSNLLLTRSSSFCNFFMDDLIGTESGVCFTTHHQQIDSDSTELLCSNRTEQNRRCAADKQFPPPIPFLAAQAGHRTRPAWILARNCVDGRLILKLERVRDHQSMESHRENGRLILNLVPTPTTDSAADEDRDRDLQFVQEVEPEGEESVECEEDSDPDFGFKSFTYGGGGGGGGGRMYFDREPFCGVNGHFEGRHVVHGHFGSAPLRPMGTVM